MPKISSYPKVWSLGHREVANIFDGKILIQEKIDGSQISFGVTNGELSIRSKGKEIDIINPEKMFSKAVEYIKSIEHKLLINYFYRGEYLQKEKHNTLTYNRVPKNNIILFDIEDIYGNAYFEFNEQAKLLDLEVVPTFYKGIGSKVNSDYLDTLLENESIIGKEKIEGIVIKNYGKYTSDKKYMVAKYVSNRFKERHNSDWKQRNPNRKDIIETIICNLKTEARYYKAIQHLRDNGELQNDVKDIGNLIKELHQDTDIEEQDYIKDTLYKHFVKDIKSGVVRGFPDWYKEYLVKDKINE